MIRFLRLFLLTMAAVGLFGQSTAMAMGTVHADTAMRSMASMDCMDMTKGASSGDVPCKKMTWQCIAAMGCATAAALEPVAVATPILAAGRVSHRRLVATRLLGRSYGPEPDPPSLLI